MIVQITPKMSKQARSMLKWNIHDVVSKCKLNPNRLEQFEKGLFRLTRTENEELYDVYTDHDIIFTKDFEVKLGKIEKKKAKSRTTLEKAIVITNEMLVELRSRYETGRYQEVNEPVRNHQFFEEEGDEEERDSA